MKHCNDNIGNRTRDLPTCSAVLQPTAPPRSPVILYDKQGNWSFRKGWHLSTRLHGVGSHTGAKMLSYKTGQCKCDRRSVFRKKRKKSVFTVFFNLTSFGLPLCSKKCEGKTPLFLSSTLIHLLCRFLFSLSSLPLFYF